MEEGFGCLGGEDVVEPSIELLNVGRFDAIAVGLGAVGAKQTYARAGRELAKQALGFADLDAARVDIVGEGPSGQQFDPEVVGDEVFAGDRQAVAVLDINRGRAGQNAVAAFGNDACETEADGDVTAILGDGRCGHGTKGGGEKKCSYPCHGLSNRLVVRPILRRRAENRLDLRQVWSTALQCGKNATVAFTVAKGGRMAPKSEGAGQ